MTVLYRTIWYNSTLKLNQDYRGILLRPYLYSTDAWIRYAVFHFKNDVIVNVSHLPTSVGPMIDYNRKIET